MLIPFYQIVVPIFCLIMVINNWIKRRSGEFNIKGFVFWNAIWVILAILAIFPDWASWFAQLTGIKDSFKALTIIALVFLFYLSFANLIKIDQLNRELTRVVRESALCKCEEDKKENEKKK